MAIEMFLRAATAGVVRRVAASKPQSSMEWSDTEEERLALSLINFGLARGLGRNEIKQALDAVDALTPPAVRLIDTCIFVAQKRRSTCGPNESGEAAE